MLAGERYTPLNFWLGLDPHPGFYGGVLSRLNGLSGYARLASCTACSSASKKRDRSRRVKAAL